MLEFNPYLLVLITVIGLCVGSFVNVVIYRLPKQLQANWKKDARQILGIEHSDEENQEKVLSVAFPPSHCPHCDAAIRPWHNIPVVSYLILQGRCSSCSAYISVQYPLVELGAAILFITIYLHFGISTQALLGLVFAITLLLLTGIDFRTQLLPDNMTLPLLWLGLLANTFGTFITLEDAVYGAVFGYLSLWGVYHIFKLLTGKEGMGYGDFKLLAAIGAWVGWQQLPFVILLSSLLGAVIGIALILLLGRDRQIPIAFGPYLAMAGWVSFLWGEQISALYFHYLP